MIPEIILVLVLIFLIYLYFTDGCGGRSGNCRHRSNQCHAEGFSLSKKPMATEWDLLNRNPFDDADYHTPTFYKV